MAYNRCKHVNPKPGCRYCPTGEVGIELVPEPFEPDDDPGSGPV